MRDENPKSRDNWSMNFKPGQYEEIFGDVKIKGGTLVVGKKTLKYKVDITDNPKHKEWKKLGKEVCRFTQLGGSMKQADTKFKQAVAEISQKKYDNTLDKKIAREVIDKYKRR